MMENMDISCGEVVPGNESAMSVDDGMDVCSDYDNSQVKHFGLNINTTVLGANNSQASPGSKDATSEMGDSANTTVLLNSSFPTQERSVSEDTEKVVRFPLGNAKESNQSNILLNNSKECFKSDPVNHTISMEMRLLEKENIFAKSWSEPLFEFPTQTTHHSDKFPLDKADLVSVMGTTPTQCFFAEPEEEHFTPGSDYIFSAADFDCLLSRGSQAAAADLTAGAVSSQAETASELPRNSVLINFDPLLRRQTIVKTDNNGSLGNLESPSACLALVEFAQRQHQTNLENTPLIPLLDNTIEGIRQEQDPNSVLAESEVSTLVEISSEQLNITLTTNFHKRDIEANVGPVEKSPNLPEKILIVPECLSDCDSINLVNRNPNQLHEDNEGAVTLKSTEHVSHSCDSLEQNFLESYENVQQGTEHLFTENEIPVTEPVRGEILQSNTPSADVVNKSIDLVTAEQHQENLKQATDSGLAVLLESQSISVPVAKSGVDTDSIAEFTTAPAESNALISLSKMIAEPLQEKQNSTIHNMSDDRMALHEDENVETGKKSKNEEINIADMEKKMHDVELREENMLKRITEKDKTISKMSNVVEAYERTIAELISEKEMLIRNHELECESLKQDNDINAQHLESLEKTFSNLYAKYERMKKNAIKYKDHEEKLVEKVMKLEECLRAQEQRYEKMKSHAMSQLEIANTKIDEATRNHSQESAKLKAQIKKEELYRISINEQLIQKSKENEELVKICDELISETN